MVRIHSILFKTLLAILIGLALKTSILPHSIPMPNMTIDGPYVFYKNDSVSIKYVEDNSGTASVKEEDISMDKKNNIDLKVSTDEPGKTFTVKLKDNLSDEKPITNGVKKMLVVSDIEGNFAAFRKLLQANGVIDENFNWTFDKGHLVLVGDFVDRGTMVTEVLWLIYSLEEKAKAAGGYVHFILGNHEIMNMSGDVRYVQERYMQHATMMNTNYMELFGPDTEIGRWLATKNVVERVGNILFTHGGISSYMNSIQISLKELNHITRPYYTDTTYQYKDERLNLMYSEYGPFWYRGYYIAPRATMAQIDSTLNFYLSKFIVTGHTIVADNIVSLFDGKLIDTDVHHAGGHSEALLIEGRKLWRVDAEGVRFPVTPLVAK